MISETFLCVCVCVCVSSRVGPGPLGSGCGRSRRSRRGGANASPSGAGEHICDGVGWGGGTSGVLHTSDRWTQAPLSSSPPPIPMQMVTAGKQKRARISHRGDVWARCCQAATPPPLYIFMSSGGPRKLPRSVLGRGLPSFGLTGVSSCLNLEFGFLCR